MEMEGFEMDELWTVPPPPPPLLPLAVPLPQPPPAAAMSAAHQRAAAELLRGGAERVREALLWVEAQASPKTSGASPIRCPMPPEHAYALLCSRPVQLGPRPAIFSGDDGQFVFKEYRLPGKRSCASRRQLKRDESDGWRNSGGASGSRDVPFTNPTLRRRSGIIQARHKDAQGRKTRFTYHEYALLLPLQPGDPPRSGAQGEEDRSVLLFHVMSKHHSPAAKAQSSRSSRPGPGLAPTLVLGQPTQRNEKQHSYVQFAKGGATLGMIREDGRGLNMMSRGGDIAEWHPMHAAEGPFSEGSVVGMFGEGGALSLVTPGAAAVGIITRKQTVVGSRPGLSGETGKTSYDSVAYVGLVPVRLIGPAVAGSAVVPSGMEDGTAKAVLSHKDHTGQVVVGRITQGDDECDGAAERLVEVAVTRPGVASIMQPTACCEAGGGGCWYGRQFAAVVGLVLIVVMLSILLGAWHRIDGSGSGSGGGGDVQPPVASCTPALLAAMQSSCHEYRSSSAKQLLMSLCPPACAEEMRRVVDVCTLSPNFTSWQSLLHEGNTHRTTGGISSHSLFAQSTRQISPSSGFTQAVPGPARNGSVWVGGGWEVEVTFNLSDLENATFSSAAIYLYKYATSEAVSPFALPISRAPQPYVPAGDDLSVSISVCVATPTAAKPRRRRPRSPMINSETVEGGGSRRNGGQTSSTSSNHRRRLLEGSKGCKQGEQPMMHEIGRYHNVGKLGAAQPVLLQAHTLATLIEEENLGDRNHEEGGQHRPLLHLYLSAANSTVARRYVGVGIEPWAHQTTPMLHLATVAPSPPPRYYIGATDVIGCLLVESESSADHHQQQLSMEIEDAEIKLNADVVQGPTGCPGVYKDMRHTALAQIKQQIPCRGGSGAEGTYSSYSWPACCVGGVGDPCTFAPPDIGRSSEETCSACPQQQPLPPPKYTGTSALTAKANDDVTPSGVSADVPYGGVGGGGGSSSSYQCGVLPAVLSADLQKFYAQPVATRSFNSTVVVVQPFSRPCAVSAHSF